MNNSLIFELQKNPKLGFFQLKIDLNNLTKSPFLENEEHLDLIHYCDDQYELIADFQNIDEDRADGQRRKTRFRRKFEARRPPESARRDQIRPTDGISAP